MELKNFDVVRINKVRKVIISLRNKLESLDTETQKDISFWNNQITQAVKQYDSKKYKYSSDIETIRRKINNYLTINEILLKDKEERVRVHEHLINRLSLRLKTIMQTINEDYFYKLDDIYFNFDLSYDERIKEIERSITEISNLGINDDLIKTYFTGCINFLRENFIYNYYETEDTPYIYDCDGNMFRNYRDEINIDCPPIIKEFYEKYK